MLRPRSGVAKEGGGGGGYPKSMVWVCIITCVSVVVVYRWDWHLWQIFVMLIPPACEPPKP